MESNFHFFTDNYQTDNFGDKPFYLVNISFLKGRVRMFVAVFFFASIINSAIPKI